MGRQSNGHQLNRAGSHNHFEDVVASAEDLRRKKMAEKRAEQQVITHPFLSPSPTLTPSPAPRRGEMNHREPV